MAIILYQSKSLEANVLCLDKDGLLFDSIVFWNALWKKRVEQLSSLMGTDGISLWNSISGGEPLDRSGPFALAYPRDEMVIAAAVIYKVTGEPWDECIRLAEEGFNQADRLLDLHSALKPMPGFPQVIHRAKSAGMKVAIVTSDDETRTDLSLRLYGIRELVDYICTPANVNRGKPYPDMLYKVAEVLNCRPCDLVMVGDSIVDVEMAKNAGAKGISIPDKSCIHVFKDYEIVESLEGIGFRMSSG